jgi:hypothetical protein
MPETNGDGPTQETEQGLTIPVPTRDEITKALAEVAKPDKSPDPPLHRRKRRTKQQ